VPRSRKRSRTSYTGRGIERQSLPYFRAAILGVIALAAAGCSTTSLDPIQTGSVIRAAVADGVDPSDWETVRQTIARIGAEAVDLAWQNPRTGSSGTLTALAAEPRTGSVCRAFATTVNDLRGIRSYRGEACRSENAGWRLTGITPDDSVLL